MFYHSGADSRVVKDISFMSSVMATQDVLQKRFGAFEKSPLSQGSIVKQSLLKIVDSASAIVPLKVWASWKVASAQASPFRPEISDSMKRELLANIGCERD